MLSGFSITAPTVMCEQLMFNIQEKVEKYRQNAARDDDSSDIDLVDMSL